jgi:hypothetical protein
VNELKDLFLLKTNEIQTEFKRLDKDTIKLNEDTKLITDNVKVRIKDCETIISSRIT